MPEKSTAFAVIGDRYHNSDYIRTALGKTLVRDLGLTSDFTDDVKSLNAETLPGYKMLITFRDGMIWPQGYGAGGSLPPHVSDRRCQRSRGPLSIGSPSHSAGGQRFCRRRRCCPVTIIQLHRRGMQLFVQC